MRAKATLALLLTALLISGCGGGDSAGTGSQTNTSTQAQEAAGGDSKQVQGSEGKSSGATQSPLHRAQIKNPPIAKERAPGSKAVAPDVPVSKGSDNSIQAFGLEGEEDQAEQATANLKAYLEARVRGDWAAACDAVSDQLKEELTELIERAKTKDGAEKPEGCSETLELFFGKSPASTLQEAAQIDRVLSFRVREDGYAYLIYESGGKVKFVAMANDEGTWKANVPEPEAFESSQSSSQGESNQ